MFELVYPLEPPQMYPLPTALNPFPVFPKGDEVLPIVEPSGLVTGRACRSWVHGGNRPLHPVVHLHILDRRGRLYLQKRSMGKDLLPGYWDTAVGGHVSYGEQLKEALFREASEELGLVEFNPEHLLTYVFENPDERELVNVYAIVGDFNPVPDGSEVECGAWWTFGDIRDNIGKSVLTPNFEGEFPKIEKALAALL